METFRFHATAAIKVQLEKYFSRFFLPLFLFHFAQVNISSLLAGRDRDCCCLHSFCSDVRQYCSDSGTQHEPAVSSLPAEGRDTLQKETKSSLPSSRRNTVNSLPSASRTLEPDPALALPNELEFESDKHPRYQVRGFCLGRNR